APTEPINVKVESFTATSVNLTWELPAEENGILEEYIVSWARGKGSFINQTIPPNDNSYEINGLSEGNYSFIVSVTNTYDGKDGRSEPSETIYQLIDGPPSPCGGGCIAGIIIGVLIVALAVSAFIFKDKIKNKFNQEK
ncbi:unnamed protein product, partial [Meganyctiphanes norvegica]